jgi:hypothetical protein
VIPAEIYKQVGGMWARGNLVVEAPNPAVFVLEV